MIEYFFENPYMSSIAISVVSIISAFSPGINTPALDALLLTTSSASRPELSPDYANTSRGSDAISPICQN